MLNPALRSAPRSVSSPERRTTGCSIALWQAAGALAACAIAACTGGARAERLPALSPGDEIYRIICKDDIRACRSEAAEACNGSYQVLETSGAPVEPERVSSAPGPRSTGPRYQRLKWVGSMVIACGDRAPAAMLAEPSQPANDTPRGEPRLPAPDRLCIPGVTQECLGPAACRGAQACLADGNGYGPCDCGSGSARERTSTSPADAGAP
jgi:hypothetical protein